MFRYFLFLSLASVFSRFCSGEDWDRDFQQENQQQNEQQNEEWSNKYDQERESQEWGYDDRQPTLSTRRWRKDPQAREAYLKGTEDYQSYREQTRGSYGRNQDPSYQESSQNRNNPKWYKDSQSRKAYLRGEPDYRQYRDTSDSNVRN